jgi:hypothetical protein
MLARLQENSKDVKKTLQALENPKAGKIMHDPRTGEVDGREGEATVPSARDACLWGVDQLGRSDLVACG